MMGEQGSSGCRPWILKLLRILLAFQRIAATRKEEERKK